MTEFAFKVDFKGPAELTDAWNRFADEYVRGADKSLAEYRLTNLRLLNDLAFGDGLKQQVVGSRNYSETKRRIEEVCAAVSELAEARESRPLNRTIIQSLVVQWTELEKQRGLYPPPLAATSQGVTDEERVKMGARGLRSSCDSIAKNSSLRRSESRSLFSSRSRS